MLAFVIMLVKLGQGVFCYNKGQLDIRDVRKDNLNRIIVSSHCFILVMELYDSRCHGALFVAIETMEMKKYVDTFYQGNGKTKDVRDWVETNGMPRVLDGTDMVAFRVDLVGTYRYKKVGTKRHKVEVGCVVGVNYTTSQKMQTGFIRLAQPGLDSQLKPPSNDDYGAY
ncbi:hypothetical protein L1987_71901 [Smallanthus sonchifolius]|uniref:Uncharacterized protein n=1 Tax=Smallanthus sonchifolius TaxID=185202 RepID=A0ACB9AUD7_9ASTR|nr:hypothetical protein L1987_71901 [Smallanthus sonchifolius]